MSEVFWGSAAVPGAADPAVLRRSSSGPTRSCTCPRGWGCDRAGDASLVAGRPDRAGRRPVAHAGAARAGGAAAGPSLRLQGRRPARRTARRGPARAAAGRCDRARLRRAQRHPSGQAGDGAARRRARPRGRVDRRAQHGPDPATARRRATTPTSPASARPSSADSPTSTATRVVLLGAGGAGTAVAHALVQLGVQRLLVVDPDHERARSAGAFTRRAPDQGRAGAGLPVRTLPTRWRRSSGAGQRQPDGHGGPPGLAGAGRSCSDRTCGSPTSSTARSTRRCSERLARPGAPCSTAPAWRSTRPPTPSS